MRRLGLILLVGASCSRGTSPPSVVVVRPAQPDASEVGASTPSRGTVRRPVRKVISDCASLVAILNRNVESLEKMAPTDPSGVGDIEASSAHLAATAREVGELRLS